MDLKDKKIGFAMCGSFCTFKRTIAELEKLAKTGCDIMPIMSKISASTDTRFGTAEFFVNKVEEITGKKIITEIKDAEPIGPKNLLDALVVMPCTGNSLSKIASGITDTSVTMAVKAHLRNQKPVLLAVSTNEPVIIVLSRENLVKSSASVLSTNFFVIYGKYNLKLSLSNKFYKKT